MSEVLADPQWPVGPVANRRRFSRTAIVAFILAAVAPIPLGVGGWVFVSSYASPDNLQSNLWLLVILIDIVVGATPLAGVVLGIVVVATNRRKRLAGQGLAIASIVVGGVLLLVLPFYIAAMLLEFLTVTNFG
jgi:formate hydrogenlyase subunit 3/multisubunit Na+/H+ antiporter MnhD subunit